MRINAKTKYGEKVFIVQFINDGNDILAITVDGRGKIYTYKLRDIIVIDGQYLR